MPLPLKYFTAFRPSLVSGHFTTALGAIWDSSSPSFTMPSKSVATTSRLTSPGTIEQISSTSGRNGRFSLAINEGLVVTPSTTPSATPSLISLTFAVSRKIFIASSLAIGSLSLDSHVRARAHFLEDAGITLNLAHDVHRAGGAALVAATGRRGPEEDAEGVAGRPVGEIAQVDHLARRFGGGRHTDVEIDLVAPRRALRLDRQRIPDGARRLRVVELRHGRHRPCRDPNPPLHAHEQVRRRLGRVSSTHGIGAGSSGWAGRRRVDGVSRTRVAGGRERGWRRARRGGKGPVPDQRRRTRCAGRGPSRIGAAEACRVVVSPPAGPAASRAPGPLPLSVSLILSERRVERCAISDRGPGFALDRQRPGARGGG